MRSTAERRPEDRAAGAGRIGWKRPRFDVRARPAWPGYAAAALALWLLCGTRPAPAALQADSSSFAFFAPVVGLSASEQQALDRDEVVVRVLDSHEGDLAVFAAAAIDATPDTLARRVQAIAELKRSRFVPAIRRFSSPPAAGDLEGLSLEDSEVEDLRRCRPSSCGLKLGAAEMRTLQDVMRKAGPQWKAAAQDAFRALVLDRVRRYLREGHAGLEPYADDDPPVRPGDAFARVLAASPYLRRDTPHLATFLARFPAAPAPDIESFLYWSKELLGGKPVVMVTHVAIARGGTPPVPPVLVAGKQVFATHYTNGALGLTTILPGRDGRRYLAYLNRSRADVFGGAFGWLVRAVAERRVKNEAGEVIKGLRARLES